MLLKISIVISIIAGILSSVNLFKKDSPVQNSNRILGWFVLFVVITLAGRFFYTYQPLTLILVRLLFIGDFLIFAFGPLLYLYLTKLFLTNPLPKVRTWIHFIPLFAYFIFVLPILFLSNQDTIRYLRLFNTTFHGIELFAIIQNIFYIILNFSLLKRFNNISMTRQSSLPNLILLNTILLITCTAILIWFASYLVRTFLPDHDDNFLGYQLVWFSLSFLVLLLSYMVLLFPSLFQFVNENIETPVIQNQPKEDYTEYAKLIDAIMVENKPYLQPKITLNELSDLTGINRNLLSRIINEHYGKNFFDFINIYRITEFKAIAESSKNENLTILALAYQAGFNSKTTFNTAFKKLMNTTPGEYYKNIIKSAV